MNRFTDNAARVWDVEITVETLKRVRSLIDVDLARIMSGEPSLLSRLTGMDDGSVDVILICDVLYAICEPQARAAGVDDLQFGRAMSGEAIQSGQAALMGELQLFFSGLGRPETAKAIEKKQALVQAAIRATEAGLDQIDPLTILSMNGKPSTAVPESSASIPDPSPSGS